MMQLSLLQRSKPDILIIQGLVDDWLADVELDVCTAAAAP